MLRHPSTHSDYVTTSDAKVDSLLFKVATKLFRTVEQVDHMYVWM